MPVIRSIEEILIRARQRLAMTQVEMATAVGTSVRTLSRWEGGRSSPDASERHKVAALLYPVDPQLAREAAAAGGKTLEELGLEKPASPPAPAPLPAPLPPAPPARLLVDAVVCAVASTLEAIEGAPVPIARARAAVASALTTARDLHLDLDAAVEALSPAPASNAQSRAEGSPASAEPRASKGRK
jgi:transcriptional regulator with XRE-family HTH domain